MSERIPHWCGNEVVKKVPVDAINGGHSANKSNFNSSGGGRKKVDESRFIESNGVKHPYPSQLCRSEIENSIDLRYNKYSSCSLSPVSIEEESSSLVISPVEKAGSSSVSQSIDHVHLPQLIHERHFTEEQINWNIQSKSSHSHTHNHINSSLSLSPLSSTCRGEKDARVKLITSQYIQRQPGPGEFSTSTSHKVNKTSFFANSSSHLHTRASSSTSANSDSPRAPSSAASFTQFIVQPLTNKVPVSVEIHASPSLLTSQPHLRSNLFSHTSLPSSTLTNSNHHHHHHSAHHHHWSSHHARKKLRLGHTPSNVADREMTVFTVYKPPTSTSSSVSRHMNHHNVHIISSSSSISNGPTIKELAIKSRDNTFTMNLPTSSNNLTAASSTGSSPLATSVFHPSTSLKHSHSSHCSGSNQLSLPTWNNNSSSNSSGNNSGSCNELSASNCNLETIAEETPNLSPVSKNVPAQLPSPTASSTVSNAASRAKSAVTSLFPCVHHSSSWNSLSTSTTTDSIATTKHTKIAGKSFSHNTLIAASNDGAPGGGNTGDDDEDLPQSTSIDLPLATVSSNQALSSNNSIYNSHANGPVNSFIQLPSPVHNDKLGGASSTSTIVTIHPSNQQRTRRKSSILSVDKLFKNKIIATTTNTARTSIASRLSITSDQDLRVTNFNRLTDLRKMLNEEDEKDDLMTIFWHKFNTCDWFDWNLNNAAKLVTIGVFVVTFILITRAVINLNWHR